MIKEIINSIIEAEAKAEEILQEAQAKSKDIIADADGERIAIVKSNKEDTKQKAKAIFDAGEKAADTAAEEVITKGQSEANALFEEGMKKSPKAREYIVRRIISKYGTR